MPSRGVGSTCTRCQERKVRCSHTLGRPKRRVDGELGGSATKRPRRAEVQAEGGLEERKVRALEKIAAQLERVGDQLEGMGGEARLGNDLAALVYMRDTQFESVDWAHRDRLAELATRSGELDIERKWREDQEGKGGKSKGA